ncbi:MAG TPA: carbonic anhydrase [Candidatus Baltobacteraceae bacterium]|nr:carbonic anhydrase [Candidatus Baltobacteraceae bacterium]
MCQTGFSRRGFVASAAALACLPFASGFAPEAPGTVAQPSAAEALTRLTAGNQRFVNGSDTHHLDAEAHRLITAGGQQPFAMLLSCSDSRVPPEIVFDQGIGALFVARVAGNYASPGAIGSFEYAIDHFQPPLIVVLGHEACGAIVATIGAIKAHQTVPGDLGKIVEAIEPAVIAAQSESGNAVQNAIRENVRLTIGNLKKNSSLIAAESAAGKLKIVGAEYALATGRVEILS